MGLKFIVVGDATSHGGRVVEGSLNHSIGGKPIARKGDWVECPQAYPDGRPHGRNRIIEGDESFKLAGIPVALHGHRTECGCTLIGCVDVERGE